MAATTDQQQMHAARLLESCGYTLSPMAFLLSLQPLLARQRQVRILQILPESAHACHCHNAMCGA